MTRNTGLMFGLVVAALALYATRFVPALRLPFNSDFFAGVAIGLLIMWFLERR